MTGSPECLYYFWTTTNMQLDLINKGVIQISGSLDYNPTNITLNN